VLSLIGRFAGRPVGLKYQLGYGSDLMLAIKHKPNVPLKSPFLKDHYDPKLEGSWRGIAWSLRLLDPL
jgi:hypothetical protein